VIHPGVQFKSVKGDALLANWDLGCLFASKSDPLSGVICIEI
jgi:hypothetical protein